MFLLFRKACLLDKTSKIVFSRFIFTIYDMGIQWVTRGYNGLQGVTNNNNNNNNNNFINLLKKAFQLNLQCQISKT